MVKIDRTNEIKNNKYGCVMKIVKYNNCEDIIVEFQDDWKATVHTTYKSFKDGTVKNPYNPIIYGVGAIGEKYAKEIHTKYSKEYEVWFSMMTRCYSKKYKTEHPAYMNVTCCDEWLIFENFCDWLHSQENFKKWLNGTRWAIDKDIINKGAKIYSPDNCCLVPQQINNLFILKKDKGEYYIGVYFDKIKISLRHK